MKELFSALAQAQGEIKSIPKNKEVVKRGRTKDGKDFSYSYKYADLDSIIETLRPVLAKNGLGFTQSIERTAGGDMTCVTSIFHSSGSTMVGGTCPVIIEGNDMQKIGAAITYAKRYCLSLAFGISTDDDLDANELQDDPGQVKDLKTKATVTHVVTVATPDAPPMPPTTFVKYPLSDKQVARLWAKATAAQWPRKYADAYLKANYNKLAKDLTKTEYEAVCEFFDSSPFSAEHKVKYEAYSSEPKIMEAFKEAKKKYVDHTLPPLPDDQFAPTIDPRDELPF